MSSSEPERAERGFARATGDVRSPYVRYRTETATRRSYGRYPKKLPLTPRISLLPSVDSRSTDTTTQRGLRLDPLVRPIARAGLLLS